jgi:uncharacterized protein YjiS (DUF1127 family)
MDPQHQELPGVYAVEVTQEWSATTVVLVEAPSAAVARTVARQEVSFSSFDAESDGKTAAALKRLTPEELADLGEESEIGAAAPIEDEAFMAHLIEFNVTSKDGPRLIKQWRGRKVSRAELIELVTTPEAIEAARLARIEANNGQLPLITTHQEHTP